MNETQTAWVIVADGTIGPGRLMSGIETQYWTAGGIPVFMPEEDARRMVDTSASGSAKEAIAAPPGTVGIDMRKSKLFTVLRDGTCYKLCDLNDDTARKIMHTVNPPETEGEDAASED